MIEVAVEIANPFPGLRSFNEDESHLFFGREQQVDELLIRLRQHHFIAVIGMSGSGKSSLIKAGLIPALRSGFMTKIGSNWEIALCRIGENPTRSLAKSLYDCDILKIDEAQPTETQLSILQMKLERSENALTSLIEESRLPSNDNLLIVVDQFEEIFQHKAKGPKEAADALAFIRLLLDAIEQRNSSIYVVITMRSDFIDNCAELPGLIDAINASQYIIPRMSREQLRLAVSGPVRVGGGMLSNELEQRLLNDIDDNPDQLPILQHAMMRTWDYWGDAENSSPKDSQVSQEHLIQVHHYEAIGTMERALSMHAEEAFHELSENEKLIAQKMFQCITEQRSQSVGVRRPTPFGQVSVVTGANQKKLLKVIDCFAKEGRSFVTLYGTGREVAAHTIIDISHESIMRLWSRLTRWVEDEAESAQVYLRLCHAAELYDGGRSGLLKDPELGLALRWYEQQSPNEEWAERYDPAYQRAEVYLIKSKEERDWEITYKEEEQRKKLKRSKTIAIVFGILTIISILFLIYAIVAQVDATKNLNKAKEEEAKAKQSKVQAFKERARAMTSEQEAFKQKEKAIENAMEARVQSQIAKQNAEEALRQKSLAVENEAIAKEQAKIAREQTAEAKRQEGIATTKQQEAEQQREIANQERDKATRLRMRAVAKTLAAGSIRIIEKERAKDKAALALQSYAFNKAFEGDVNDPTIFEALLKADELLGIGGSRVYEDHSEAVGSIDLSLDGQYILSGSLDGRIVWRNRTTGEKSVFQSCIDNRCGVRELVFSPNNSNKFASAHQDHTIRIWQKGEKKPTLLKAHEDIVRAVAFSADGKWLYSGDVQGKIFIWDLTNLEEPYRSISLPKERIVQFSHHPKNSDLIIATEQGNIWALPATAQKPNILANGLGKLLSVAFDANNTLVAGNSDGKLFIIDLNTGDKKEYSEHKSGITGVTISPDGKFLASSSFDKTIKIFEMGKLNSIPIELRVNDWIYDVRFSKNGSTITFCTAGNKVREVPTKLADIADGICNAIKDKKVSPLIWMELVGSDISQKESCP